VSRGSVHNLVVDAYAMQHPEEYGRSAKSYFQHLTALCCGVECAGKVSLYWSIAPTFEHTPPPPKPPLLTERGSVTIADVVADSGVEYPRRVRDWAAAVWRAYASQHALAHDRLALAAFGRSAPRRRG
jgi:hypothetical protein